MSEHKLSLPKEEPLAMSPCDYGSVYARKYSEFKDDQTWTSMYEKNLGRKVSEQPPWLHPEADDTSEQDVRKERDFVSVQKEKAVESGSLGQHRIRAPDFVQTAEQRRARRRQGSSSRSSTMANRASNGNMETK